MAKHTKPQPCEIGGCSNPAVLTFAHPGEYVCEACDQDLREDDPDMFGEPAPRAEFLN